MDMGARVTYIELGVLAVMAAWGTSGCGQQLLWAVGPILRLGRAGGKRRQQGEVCFPARNERRRCRGGGQRNQAWEHRRKPSDVGGGVCRTTRP